METALFRVMVKQDHGDIDISQESVTIAQLLREVNSRDLAALGLARISSEKIDKDTQEHMRQAGWVHPSTLEDRLQRKSFEQEFFMLDENDANYYGKRSFNKVDINHLTVSQLNQLAGGAHIVQGVVLKSILSESEYRRYRTAKKKKEEQVQKIKAAKVAKAATKKQKQIEKAKKILAEASMISPGFNGDLE